MVTKNFYSAKNYATGDTVKSLHLQYLRGSVVMVNYHNLVLAVKKVNYNSQDSLVNNLYMSSLYLFLKGGILFVFK